MFTQDESIRKIENTCLLFYYENNVYLKRSEADFQGFLLIQWYVLTTDEVYFQKLPKIIRSISKSLFI